MSDVMMPLAELLDQYHDGDEIGWDAEFEYLRTDKEHEHRLSRLSEDVQRRGILTPILLGYDGRVWDGHHRLCVADALGLIEVPVTFSAPDNTT